MPLYDADGEPIELKFDEECVGCKFARKPRTCRGCDAGELFEELDPEGLDGILRF